MLLGPDYEWLRQVLMATGRKPNTHSLDLEEVREVAWFRDSGFSVSSNRVQYLVADTRVALHDRPLLLLALMQLSSVTDNIGSRFSFMVLSRGKQLCEMTGTFWSFRLNLWILAPECVADEISYILEL